MTDLADVLIVVPVLDRPAAVKPLADSARAAIGVPTRLLFVASDHDGATHAAVGMVADWFVDLTILPGALRPGDYARKINHAYRTSAEPWLFTAGDDLEFEPGWDIAALTVAAETGAGVVGTNDDANPSVKAGHSATHSLIRRSYVEECGGSLDGPGVVLHEGYGHQYVDSELVELARSRGCYAHASDAVVRHRHPFWGTAAKDSTYERGQATRSADQRLYQQRRHGWGFQR